MAWFHDFFDDEYVAILKSKRPTRITRKEVDLIEAALQLQPGMSVLDIPSGFGRHSYEFGRRGYQVTAVDLSAAMFQSRLRHDRVKYYQMDMRRIQFKDEFDGVFVSSSGYFNDAQNRALLKKLARALKSGGRLMLWAFSPKARAQEPQGRRWTQHGSRYVLEEYSYDSKKQCYKAKWIIWKPFAKAPSIKRVCLLGYTITQWRKMLHAAGLKLVEVQWIEKRNSSRGGMRLVASKIQK